MVDYDVLYFHMAPLRPSNVRATTSQYNFDITGVNSNCDSTSQEKDLSNMVNYVTILGYGDGINQLETETYNASTVYSLLASDITATSTTITLIDASSFPSSGEIRIAKERITYTGKSGNDLTGCTRGTSGTTARTHKKYVYCEQYYVYTSPEANSSIDKYGLMDYTIVDRTLLDEDTAELIATRYLLDRMNPILRIKIIPNEPQTISKVLGIGDLVTITDAESGLAGDYRIIGIEYTSDYGNLSMEIEISNRSLEFIEQMQKERDQNQNLQRYMQGATNIYCIPYAENIDSSHPGYIRFYLPPDCVALNRVKVNFKMKNYRADATSITAAPSFKQRMSGWFSIGEAFNKGNFGTISDVVSDLSFTQKSNCISDLSVTWSSRYFLNYSGSLYGYAPEDFADNIFATGIVDTWWNLNGNREFPATSGTWYGNTVPSSFGWTNNSLLNGWDFTNNSNVVNSWTNITWNDPVYTKVTAPTISGTFDKIKVTATIHNGYNETKTPTIYLYRDATIVATYSPSIGPYEYYFIDYEDSTDYMGSTYKVQIPLTGFNVNHTTAPDSSYILLNVASYVKTSDTIVYGIHENSSEFTPPGTIIVKAGTEGSESAVGTYTSDQEDLDITAKIPSATGAWYVVKFDSNHINNNSFGGRMRLEANMYVQLFIQSK